MHVDLWNKMKAGKQNTSFMDLSVISLIRIFPSATLIYSAQITVYKINISLPHTQDNKEPGNPLQLNYPPECFSHKSGSQTKWKPK